MTEFSGAWSREEVAAFLAGATVPIRIAVNRPDETVWIVALWFRFHDEGFECATWANAAVVRFLRHDSEVGFDVSTNEPPYRGVRGTGTASLAPDRDKRALASLIERYLGGTESGLARWLLEDDREEVRIHIHPRECYSWDYTERMRGVVQTTQK